MLFRKPRLKATHFIEQYNGKHIGVVHSFAALPIEILNDQLELTDQCTTFATVAIWKIKFKNAA